MNLVSNNPQRYTEEEARKVATLLCKGPQQGVYFYFNIMGWTSWFTRIPTISTPTGEAKKKGFPRKVLMRPIRGLGNFFLEARVVEYKADGRDLKHDRRVVEYGKINLG